MIKVRLGRSFVVDREERGLECGTVTFRGQFAYIEADQETIDDMGQDANYQAYWTDNDNKSFLDGCSRAFKVLEPLMSVPIPKSQVRPPAGRPRRSRYH